MIASLSYFTSPNWDQFTGLGNNYPAYNVNWFDAVLYCNALTKSYGKTDTVYSYTSITGNPGNGCTIDGLNIDFSKNGYRLPTEGEWEYACRGGNPRETYWAGDRGTLSATYFVQFGTGAERVEEVGKLVQNNYGLYDMCGNVLEWCNDWYSATAYSLVGSPPSNYDPKGPFTGFERVMRSSGWTWPEIEHR